VEAGFEPESEAEITGMPESEPERLAEERPAGEAEAAPETAAEAEATLEGRDSVAADPSLDPAATSAGATAPAEESVPEPDLDYQEIDARLAGVRGAPPSPNGESTQVIVVGLISVPSIATFKRQLSRLPGVKSVGVSSGPDGEFVFTVGHSADTSLGELIPALPGFQARVVSLRDGVLNISAHDPETEV
jgi:hypothetical protein